MSTIIGGSSPSVTFPDSTVQDTSAIVGGKVPYANLPSGSVLQVVNATYSTEVATTTSTWVDTNLSATITPKFATSKILIIGAINGLAKFSSSTNVGVRLLNGSTTLKVLENTAGYDGGTGYNQIAGTSISYLDSPASTSAQTYKFQFNSGNNTSGVHVHDTNATSSITLLEIAQ